MLAVLPAAVPAPRLRWSDEVDDWVLLGIDPVRGRMPGPQWNAADLAGVVRACEAAAAALDPAPAGMELSRLADDLDDGGAWRRWYDDVAAGRRTTTLLSPWARSALPDLHRMLQESGPAIDGEVACHGDLRPDNMVVDGNGAVWICDWNWLSLGAAWTDLVGLLVIVHGDGGDADARSGRRGCSTVSMPRRSTPGSPCSEPSCVRRSRTPTPSSVSAWLGRHRAYFGTSALSWLEARHSS